MQINRTLRERITAENRARHIPEFIQRRRVAVQGYKRFKKSSQAVCKNADCPPQKMRAAFSKIAIDYFIKEKSRKRGRQNRQIMNRA